MTEKVSKALEEVWEWKEAVYNDIKDLSPEERIVFFRERSDRLLEKLDLEKVKVREGVYRLKKRDAPRIVAEEKEEYSENG